MTEREATGTWKSQQFLAAKPIHEQWKNDYLGPDIEPFYEAAFERIVQRLGAKPGASVLDAGCGYCYHAMRLARRGLAVTGVDFSAAALEAARENLSRQGLHDKVTLRQGDLLQLPFADASFDHASCWGVLMHVPEVDRALAELVRVVKPGGRIALMENNVRSLHVAVWEPLLRLAKRLLGRRPASPSRTMRGIEEWHGASGTPGALLVRKTDLRWLAGHMRELGAPLVARDAGQLTEIYTSLRPRLLKQLVHALNRAWFRWVRWPGPAMGNLLVFEKRAAR